ncbi:MAG: C40 family peptidase [Verrucomicrobiae bacterium]|nr:C40 family peptidase [Verrucomicrobiae bacterium]
MVAIAWLSAPAPSVRAAPESGRFTVVGWVKNKLSPEEEARSAARASRLRPVAAAPADTLAAATMRPVPEADSGAFAAAGPGSIPPPPLPAETRAPAPPRDVAPSPPPASKPARGRGADNAFTGQPTVAELRRRAEFLSGKGLVYKFGGDHPSEGGMDCSGTMQFMLKDMGWPDIPRTSYDQYDWLREKGTLRKVGFFHSSERAYANLRPGDLIFWGGTYNSGHKVSHVMVYLGKSRSGKQFMFGARGKGVKGLNGSGVDIFELKPGHDGHLVGYGPLPGIRDRG